MDSFKITNTGIALLIIGLIAGFLIGHFAVPQGTFERSDMEEVVDEGSVTNSEVADFSSTNIEVLDQDAGSRVFIKTISLNEKSWVAVREDVSGDMGNILGAVRLESGDHQNVEVELLRGTMAGGLYYVVVYKDNGDESFDHNFDSLVTDGTDPVSDTFIATLTQ